MKELRHLVTGYKEFLNQKTHDGRYRYSDLADGQSPGIMVISCSDSRVIPSLIFNVKPGDLFVVRNVANLVPPFEKDQAYHGTSAALEFALLELEVEHIVVLGHSSCGGIQACLHEHKKTAPVSFFIRKWISILKPTAEQVHSACSDAGEGEEAEQKTLELAAIKTSLQNLKTFPFINERLENNSVSIHGAYFDLESGQLSLLNPDSGKFDEVE